MTVRDLITALGQLPPEHEVFVKNAQYGAPDPIKDVARRTVYGRYDRAFFDGRAFVPGEAPPVGREAIVLE